MRSSLILSLFCSFLVIISLINDAQAGILTITVPNDLSFYPTLRLSLSQSGNEKWSTTLSILNVAITKNLNSGNYLLTLSKNGHSVSKTVNVPLIAGAVDVNDLVSQITINFPSDSVGGLFEGHSVQSITAKVAGGTQYLRDTLGIDDINSGVKIYTLKSSNVAITVSDSHFGLLFRYQHTFTVDASANTLSTTIPHCRIKVINDVDTSFAPNPIKYIHYGKGGDSFFVTNKNEYKGRYIFPGTGYSVGVAGDSPLSYAAVQSSITCNNNEEIVVTLNDKLCQATVTTNQVADGKVSFLASSSNVAVNNQVFDTKTQSGFTAKALLFPMDFYIIYNPKDTLAFVRVPRTYTCSPANNIILINDIVVELTVQWPTTYGFDPSYFSINHGVALYKEKTYSNFQANSDIFYIIESDISYQLTMQDTSLGYTGVIGSVSTSSSSPRQVLFENYLCEMTLSYTNGEFTKFKLSHDSLLTIKEKDFTESSPFKYWVLPTTKLDIDVTGEEYTYKKLVKGATCVAGTPLPLTITPCETSITLPDTSDFEGFTLDEINVHHKTTGKLFQHYGAATIGTTSHSVYLFGNEEWYIKVKTYNGQYEASILSSGKSCADTSAITPLGCEYSIDFPGINPSAVRISKDSYNYSNVDSSEDSYKAFLLDGSTYTSFVKECTDCYEYKVADDKVCASSASVSSDSFVCDIAVTFTGGDVTKIQTFANGNTQAILSHTEVYDDEDFDDEYTLATLPNSNNILSIHTYDYSVNVSNSFCCLEGGSETFEVDHCTASLTFDKITFKTLEAYADADTDEPKLAWRINGNFEDEYTAGVSLLPNGNYIFKGITEDDFVAEFDNINTDCADGAAITSDFSCPIKFDKKQNNKINSVLAQRCYYPQTEKDICFTDSQLMDLSMPGAAIGEVETCTSKVCSISNGQYVNCVNKGTKGCTKKSGKICVKSTKAAENIKSNLALVYEINFKVYNEACGPVNSKTEAVRIMFPNNVHTYTAEGDVRNIC